MRAIRENGWTQGCVLPSDLAAFVTMHDGTPLAPDRERAIVVNVACDVVHRKLANEPVVEVVRARVLDAVDSNFAARRNPRLLHLTLRDGGTDRPFALRAHDRGHVDRRLLADHRPDAACMLPPDGQDMVAEWMAARYQRTALPDAFNDRLMADKRDRRIRRVMREAADEMLAVYVLLSPAGELPPTDTYRVIVRGVMTKGAYDDTATRSRVDESFWQPLLALLAEVRTVVVTSAALISEDAFSVRDLRRMQRLEFDFLSYEGEAAGPVAPRGA